MAAGNLSTAEYLSVLESDGTGEFSFVSEVKVGKLFVRNIGVNPIALKLGSGIVNTAPSTPTQTAGEYILPSGEALFLQAGASSFFHHAEAALGTSLSVLVTT